MQKLSHRGFDGLVQFEKDFGFFAGRLIGVPGVVAFRGDTVEEAQEDFLKAVDAYLETYENAGLKAPLPRADGLWISLDPVQLDQVQGVAAAEGVSVENWATRVIVQASEIHPSR